jgi:cysteine desulfurase
LDLLEKSIRPDTILVSIMTANNEIGVIQPVAEIGAICRRYQVLFHTDSAQAIGKISLDVEEMNIDLMSLTAHKVHGPKGIGALYVRRRDPRVCLAAQIQGGGQERGLRSGTLFTPQIVGFAKAVELGIKAIAEDTIYLNQLKARLWEIISQLDGIHLNGHLTQRLAGNLNISIEGVDGAALLLGLQPVVALSSGSACSSTHTAPSHVLTALGRPKSLAYASLRFGLSRFNTLEEIERVGEQVVITVRSLRKAKS